MATCEARGLGNKNRWEKAPWRPIPGERRGIRGPEGKTAELIILFSEQEGAQHCYWRGKFWGGDEAGHEHVEGRRGSGPSPAPRKARAGSPGGEELTGTEKLKKRRQRNRGGLGRGSQQRAGRRKSTVGEGPGKSREDGRLQEAPGPQAPIVCCWGCHCHQGGQRHLLGAPKPGSSARSPGINYVRPPWSY